MRDHDTNEPEPFVETWQRWQNILHNLPAVRLDKVRETRAALQRSSYERESILDETVRRLSNDIGVLCRRATNHEPE